MAFFLSPARTLDSHLTPELSRAAAAEWPKLERRRARHYHDAAKRRRLERIVRRLTSAALELEKHGLALRINGLSLDWAISLSRGLRVEDCRRTESAAALRLRRRPGRRERKGAAECVSNLHV